jgi:hypothetical protein
MQVNYDYYEKIIDWLRKVDNAEIQVGQMYQRKKHTYKSTWYTRCRMVVYENEILFSFWRKFPARGTYKHDHLKAFCIECGQSLLQ